MDIYVIGCTNLDIFVIEYLLFLARAAIAMPRQRNAGSSSSQSHSSSVLWYGIVWHLLKLKRDDDQ